MSFFVLKEAGFAAVRMWETCFLSTFNHFHKHNFTFRKVDLTREITFCNSKQKFVGVPIMASNMDTVGTFEMAVTLAEVSCIKVIHANNPNWWFCIVDDFQHKCFTCVHKYYTLDDWKEFATRHPDALPYVAISSGIGETDFSILQNVLENIPDIKYICIDVANGYSQFFVEYVKKVRSHFPTHTIMVIS